MDFFQEYIVKRKIGIKEWILSILIIIAALVLVYISLPYVGFGFVAVLDGAIVYFSYVLISRFSVEYEYILTNDELDIDKIYARRKRNKMLNIEVKKLEICAPINDERFLNEKNNASEIKDYSTKDYSNAYFAVYCYEGGRIMFIFNPPSSMITSMKKYSPNKICE